jgi:hypothetical protein
MNHHSKRSFFMPFMAHAIMANAIMAHAIMAYAIIY